MRLPYFIDQVYKTCRVLKRSIVHGMLHHMRSPCSWSKSSAKATVAPGRASNGSFIPGPWPPSLRPYRYVRVLMAIRRKVVERATRRVDLVVVLIFALVGAELLTFLEEFVVPRPPQELDVPASAAARNGCDLSNLLPLTWSA